MRGGTGSDTSAVGFVEAHGIGTRSGDPIEVDGIEDGILDACSARGEARPVLGVSSVKSMSGHTEHAAGLARGRGRRRAEHRYRGTWSVDERAEVVPHHLESSAVADCLYS